VRHSIRPATCRYGLYTLPLHSMTLRLLIPTLALLLAGCDIPGMGPDPRALQREADGKAIGGACRYALRGIEDCYSLNEKASKTAIFAGWKDMDQYMRDNKMEGQAPAQDKEEKAPVAEDRKPPVAEAKPKPASKTADKVKTGDKPAAASEKH
jgi:hypothetical protein